MVSINKLPLKKIEDMTLATRPIGMGIMGLADAMYMLGIKYDSEEGFDFAGRLIFAMRQVAEQASIELAQERGVYPAWEGSEWQKENISIRNSTLLSIAPTGSISFLAGVSGGLEPNYGLCYTRRTYDGNLYYVVNPIFKKRLEELGIYSDALMEKISKNNGSCQGIKEVPEELQRIFVVASDISPENHVEMVARIQKHVDLSCSKTINFTNKATVKDIEGIINLSWGKGLKGLTVYRDGCRENQTLSTAATYKKEEPLPEQQYDYIVPKSKDEIGETYGTNVKRKVACGNLYINLCRNEDGELVECFINIGKDGICQSNINAISRLVSLALRSGISVDELADQLSGIKCPACTILKSQGKDIEMSCPGAIGKYIREKYGQGNNVIIKETKGKKKPELKSENKTDKMTCPNCGEKFKAEAGCLTCPNCGNSKCG